MCTYVLCFFSFALLGPSGLIIVGHFPKKCGNATMLQSVKNNVLIGYSKHPHIRTHDFGGQAD